MVRAVTQLAQSHRQELDALAQFLPIKTMLPSADYVRVGSLEKTWFSLINWVKIMWAKSYATDFHGRRRK